MQYYCGGLHLECFIHMYLVIALVGGGNPYHNVDKTAVLQEARVFNETPVNVKRSTLVLTKILYLLNQGEVLAAKEATDAFFAMTKLFQSNDLVLRRLVYLGIKVSRL